MASDSALEEKRQGLIALQGANTLKEADFQAQARERAADAEAKASQLQLGVFRELDPRALLAYALHELGANAGRVGNLTITTELLSELLKPVENKK
jgi:hypothetical protein